MGKTVRHGSDKLGGGKNRGGILEEDQFRKLGGVGAIVEQSLKWA